MTSEANGQIAAAIDIGSNSIKMTLGRPDGAGGVDQIDWASEVVRLGHDLDRTGRLDEERVVLAIDTIGRFAAHAKALGANRILTVATEATRTAQNGASFLDRLRAQTGIDVRILNGHEEAALTFRGLAASTDVSGPVVVADIGGGSTELIVARDGVMQDAQSLRLGSGRLTDRLVASDPPSADELVACEAEAAAAFESATRAMALPAGGESRLVIVGGTGEFMVRLVPAGDEITLPAVRQILSRLLELPAAELAAEIDIPEARARVLPAGVAIVAAIAELTQPDRIEIARAGIRVGLLLDAFENPAPATESDDPVTADEQLPSTSLETIAGNGSDAESQEQPAPDEEFREVMRALIAQRWEAVWQAIPAALAGTDIEGVHDVRVASRRLRAAMDVAAPVFPGKWYRPLHKAAKSITAALGDVRDRDVLLEAIRADRAQAPLAEWPGIDRLIDRVERERVVARETMEAFLVALLEGPLRETVERRFGSPLSPQTSAPNRSQH
jgi:hypothetical protein